MQPRVDRELRGLGPARLALGLPLRDRRPVVGPWGQFLFPLVLSSDLSTQPLTVVIASLQGRHVVPFTLLSAAGVLAMAVPAVIAVMLNKHIVSGLLTGSVK